MGPICDARMQRNAGLNEDSSRTQRFPAPLFSSQTAWAHVSTEQPCGVGSRIMSVIGGMPVLSVIVVVRLRKQIPPVSGSSSAAGQDESILAGLPSVLASSSGCFESSEEGEPAIMQPRYKTFGESRFWPRTRTEITMQNKLTVV